MYLDIKSTVWERVEFDDEEQMNFVLEKLKSGEITNGWEVCDLLARGSDTLIDTSEEMSVEDNDGFSTLELYDTDGFQLWNNSNIDT